MDIDESALMRAAQHNHDHFAAIYERYFPRIFAYCSRRIANQQDAEDLTATVFTRALSHLASYRGGSVGAWLFRIAHNAIVNYYKQQRPSSPFSAEQLDYLAPFDPKPSLADVVTQSETTQELHRLIEALPARQRDILLLKIVGGLSAEDIATALGLRAGTVRVTLHRTLQQLYNQIREVGHVE